MDFTVVITESATQDLRNIVHYIARHNPRAAQKLGDEILDTFQKLGTFPLMGRVVPERGDPEWRELPYGAYRLIYHVDEQSKIVEAGRVWHAARGEPEF